MDRAISMQLIDLHSHILPGLDDGAKDAAEALQMMRASAADGISIIAATPHADCAAPSQIYEGVRCLNEMARQENLGIEIVPGSEVRIETDLPERYATGELVTLNDTSYVLLELWLIGEWPPFLGTAIYDCRRVGLMPILAHAERYPPVQHSPMILADLVAAGVLIQVNAESLLRDRTSTTRKTAEVLLQSNLVHVIASDAHHIQTRNPGIRAATEYAKSMVGESYGKWLQETAAAILEGLPVKLPEPHPPRYQSRLERLWDRVLSR